MDIYLDTANTREISRWLRTGLVDGITTNPSIMLRDGFYDFARGAREIAALIAPRPVSVEVTTDDPAEMVAQAKEIAAWAPNIVVKIPQLTREALPCYGVMWELEQSGVTVNATLAMSLGQVILSAKAGASYISIFVGRIGDEGGDAPGIVRDAVQFLDRWKYRSKIIAASVRSVPDLLDAARAGADIVTTPPQFLQSITDHKLARDGVRRFMEDAKAALEQAEKAKRAGA
jgi:transaldolase